ncbi:hypothetical protein [Hyphomicrobium sulfonivorans]|uniref:hypothetical protein n=1 Tax=Hyphomicrobium sulfonivorans TaxID=121290 RepID=UPI00156EECC9|nr:hypothetical protein [Hyphomicrobium sulfonivorans]MBI1650709.1 hypothetical protein [Hyphomicrobium sulfonivorans]NSL71933.1 hypothetical protein [Hyphomicrobium sulfonivorans]
METSKTVRLMMPLLGAVLLGGCAGTDLDLRPVASLSASNMMSPSGYSEAKISDTQYTVNAMGTEATPKARIEKIARARAAQIAVEQRMPFYKVASVSYGVKCTKGKEIYRGGTQPATARQTVQLDVLYAKAPADDTYVSAKESFEGLNTELNNEMIPSEAKIAAEQEVRAACAQTI